MNITLKKISLMLLAVFIASVGAVGVLYRFSDYVIHRQGSFLRVYPPSPIVKVKALDIDIDHHNVAGITNTEIFLATKANAFELLKVCLDNLDTSNVRVQLLDPDIKSFGLELQIDSPNFYLFDGAMPFIYQGSVDSWAARRVPFDSSYFLDIIPINRFSFVTRSYSKHIDKALLTRLSPISPKLTLHPEILEKQVDGLFCTDGRLHYDKLTSTIIFIYYYRNQFVMMDSMLNIKFRGNTIDTFRTAKLEVTSLSRTNHTSRRLSSPPQYVNKSSAVADGRLFVHSVIAARNDDFDGFKETAVIDVYDIQTGSYQFSFTIDEKSGEQMKGFYVNKKHLIAVYDHRIVKYLLHPSRFALSAKTFYR